MAAFRQAVADQGIPASMLSDNGMVFTTRFAGGRAGRDTLNGFQALLRDLGVVQKHSKPNHPTTCGKVERFQQTLKKWLKAQPQQPPHDHPAANPLQHLRRLLQQLSAAPLPEPTAPPRRPTRPDPKPRRPTPADASRSPGSAATSSTPTANSASATPAGCTTSASAEPTPEPPS